jgi:hypothetical protein
MSMVEPTTETVERLGTTKAVGEPPRQERGEPSPFLPLMLLVLGLAVATTWFVVLPRLDESAPGRTCEVIVLPDKSTRCIEPRGAGAQG